MARVWLVRHGEAAAGWDAPDPQLSATGRRQAAALADALAGVGPLPLLVSPLRRTRETAAPLSARWVVDPSVDPAVGELVAPTDDLDERLAWLRRVLASRWGQLTDRDRAWRDTVVERVAGLRHNTVVVSHFVAINAVVGAATGDDRVVSFAPGNCSVTVVDVTGSGMDVVERGAEAQHRSPGTDWDSEPLPGERRNDG